MPLKVAAMLLVSGGAAAGAAGAAGADGADGWRPRLIINGGLTGTQKSIWSHEHLPNLLSLLTAN